MFYFLVDTLSRSFTSRAEASSHASVPADRQKAPHEPTSGAAPDAPAAGAAGAHSMHAASAAPSPEARLQELLNDKSCRACTSTRDLFAAFGAQLQHGGGGGFGGASAAASSSQPTPQLQTGQQQTGQQQQQQQLSGSNDSNQQQQANEQQGDKPQFWFYEEEMPEPPDVIDIGRATWTLLHTMAAYYPDAPTPDQQSSMHAFVRALGDHYPCHECRAHLRQDLERNPPDVGSSQALSMWACQLHNRVNVYLGKPEFDCGLVFQRWRDGPPAQEGEAPALYGLLAHNREVDEEVTRQQAADQPQQQQQGEQQQGQQQQTEQQGHGQQR